MATSFTFDDFTLVPSRFELRQRDLRLAVQPKVLRVLMHLVANRERVVSADELMKVVWHGEHVGTGSIKRAVICARRALGEAGDTQDSIRTVRGFGYQFVRSVHTEGAEPATSATSPADAMQALLRTIAQLPERRVEQLLNMLSSALAGRVLQPVHSGHDSEVMMS